MSTLKQSIVSNSLSLGIFSIITVGLISLIFVMTETRIAQQVQKFELKALNEIVPADQHDRSLLDSAIMVENMPLLGLDSQQKAYVAFKQGQAIGAILPVRAPDGYNGRISLLVGIRHNGDIAAVRVITHKETPGLGDGIDTKISSWIDQFAGRSLQNTPEQDWTVKKDGGQFDQFTGATITPRAVTKAVHRALIYFHDHREQLYDEARAQLSAPSPAEEI